MRLGDWGRNNIMKNVLLGVYEKAMDDRQTWLEKLILTRESGFDCLEMSVDATPQRMNRLYDTQTSNLLCKAIEHTGVPVHTMALTALRQYPLGSENEIVRDKALEIVRKAVDLSASCGISVIHLAGYDEHGDKRNEHTDRRFRDGIHRCVDYAASRGVTLAIETMDTPYMGSCRNIMALCHEIGSDRLKCYVDIGNLTASGLNIEEEISIAAGSIAGVHLKDTKPGIYRDILFGEGSVDFDACLRALKCSGYQGTMVAEMWSYDDPAFHSYLKQASAFLRKKLAQY